MKRLGDVKTIKYAYLFHNHICFNLDGFMVLVQMFDFSLEGDKNLNTVKNTFFFNKNSDKEKLLYFT